MSIKRSENFNYNKVIVWGKFGFKTCKYMEDMGHCFIFFQIKSIYLDILARITTSCLLVSLFRFEKQLFTGNHPGSLSDPGHISQWNPQRRFFPEAFAIRFESRATCNENGSSTSLGNDGLMVTWGQNLHFLSETTKKTGAFGLGCFGMGSIEKMGETDDKGLYCKIQVSVSTSSGVTVEDKKSFAGDASWYFFRLVGYSRRSTPTTYKWSHIPRYPFVRPFKRAPVASFITIVGAHRVKTSKSCYLVWRFFA